MTAITRENFTAAIEAAVVAKGADYVYPDSERLGASNRLSTCQYKTENGEPSCLIGQALFLIDPALVPKRGTSNSASVVLRSLGVLDERLVRAARTAQAVQDSRHTWGEALEEYRQTIDNSKRIR